MPLKDRRQNADLIRAFASLCRYTPFPLFVDIFLFNCFALITVKFYMFTILVKMHCYSHSQQEWKWLGKRKDLLMLFKFSRNGYCQAPFNVLLTLLMSAYLLSMTSFALMDITFHKPPSPTTENHKSDFRGDINFSVIHHWVIS